MVDQKCISTSIKIRVRVPGTKSSKCVRNEKGRQSNLAEILVIPFAAWCCKHVVKHVGQSENRSLHAKRARIFLT